MKTTIALLLLLAAPAAAQDFANSSPAGPYVKVHGEATVSVEPDRAQLDVGVISQAPTAQAASATNARQSKIVIDQLGALLSTPSIKTVNFSVNPNYRYPKDGGTPEILGYTANNTVRVEIDDLARLQKVIDAAMKAGANNVNRLNFTLKDEAKARAQALGQAAEQARAGAMALASALNLKLGEVLSVEEGQPVIVSPVRQVELSVGKGSSTAMTPVEPGSIDVHASVNLTFRLQR
jgi:uncharacterized protein